MYGKIEALLEYLNAMGFSDIKVTVRLQNNSVKITIIMYDNLEKYVRKKE